MIKALVNKKDNKVVSIEVTGHSEKHFCAAVSVIMYGLIQHIGSTDVTLLDENIQPTNDEDNLIEIFINWNKCNEVEVDSKYLEGVIDLAVKQLECLATDYSDHVRLDVSNDD